MPTENQTSKCTDEWTSERDKSPSVPIETGTEPLEPQSLHLDMEVLGQGTFPEALRTHSSIFQSVLMDVMGKRKNKGPCLQIWGILG